MKDTQIDWNRDKIEEVLLEAARKEYGQRLTYAALWVADDGFAEYEIRITEEGDND